MVTSTFQHCNLHKYTWNSPDRKTHNEIGHALKDARRAFKYSWRPNCREGNFDTDNYLIVPKVIRRLSLSKRLAQKFNSVRFNLKKLNDMGTKGKYQVKISNADEVDINRAWKSVRI